MKHACYGAHATTIEIAINRFYLHTYLDKIFWYMIRAHLTLAVALVFTATLYTLQKQVGCFNHRVVTMVADRQWLPDWYGSLIAQSNPRCMQQLNLAYNHMNTTT